MELYNKDTLSDDVLPVVIVGKSLCVLFFLQYGNDTDIS